MWKIDETFIGKIYKFTDEFVNDVFQWVLENPKVNKDSLIKTIKNPKLFNVAKKCRNLREILYNLSNSDKSNCIYEHYKYYVKNYEKILSGNMSSISLCTDAKNIAKDAFEYFYENLIETDIFWMNYSKDNKIKKIQIRKTIGEKHKICPYCNVGPISYAEASNMDHFLPISKYPVLGVFGDNLVVACLPCNLFIKNDHDGKLPIIHPYKEQVADYMNFTFDKKKKLIGINYTTTDPIKLKQTENYVSLFKIKNTYRGFWGRVQAEEELINKNIKKIVKRISVPNIQTLEDMIEEDIGDYIKYLFGNKDLLNFRS